MHYKQEKYGYGTSGLVRKRMVVFPSDTDRILDNVLERFAVSVDEIRETLEENPDPTIVLDAYITESMDPLADDDHEPLDVGD